MIYCHFKCNKCEEVIEVFKETVMEDFPNSVKCTKCKSKDTYRMWNDMPLTEVCQGSLGNSKNNYEAGMVYHPSGLTGHTKRTVVKKIK